VANRSRRSGRLTSSRCTQGNSQPRLMSGGLGQVQCSATCMNGNGAIRHASGSVPGTPGLRPARDQHVPAHARGRRQWPPLPLSGRRWAMTPISVCDAHIGELPIAVFVEMPIAVFVEMPIAVFVEMPRILGVLEHSRSVPMCGHDRPRTLPVRMNCSYRELQRAYPPRRLIYEAAQGHVTHTDLWSDS